MRILLVDDVRATRDLLASAFRQEQHEVDLATNGIEAVDLFARNRYDIVLTDIQMPILDGITAAQRMRELEAEDESRDRTPIIALTAGAKGTSHQACLDVGIDRCLMKPIDLPLLYHEVESMAKSSPQSQEDAVERAEKAPHASTFDLEDALSRLRGDREIFCRLAQFFIDDHHEVLEGIRAGLEQGEAEAVQRNAHSLKGMAASFSADAVVATARELEICGKEERLAGGSELYAELAKHVEELIVDLKPYCCDETPESND